jgi:Na+(H+)/acetate symporter ActP
MGLSLENLLMGLGMGLALATLGVGPLLRKTGAFSITDLLVARFPNLALRVGALLLVSLVGLCVGLAGLAMALRGLAQATAFGPLPCAILAAGLVALIVVPGGLAGLTWSAAAAAGLLIASIAAPLVVTIPLPMLGDPAAFAQAMARIETWRMAASPGGGQDGLIMVAMALGLAALAPLLAPAIATHGPGEARRGGLMGLAWCVIIGLMAVAVMATCALALQSGLTGLRAADVPPFLLEASGRGMINICGRNPATIAQVRSACEALPGFAGVLRTSDIAASGDYLLLGLAQLHGLGPALSGLAMAGRIASALDYVGVISVEMFHVVDNAGERLVVNEIAPRVHNSGHWTLDGAVTSQFEQHIRAVCGWPLGSTRRHGRIEMRNLIGDQANAWGALLAEPGACVHLYGKHEARAGRKMGHVTRIFPD